MKIILTQDIKGLGEKDDVVVVKDGYGRNYLIPQGMAKLANTSALKMLAEDARQREFKQERLRKDAEVKATSLQDQTIVIKTKASQNGKIFGSITSLQITNALKERGFEVDRRKVVVNNDIKFLGEYTATINLFKGIQAQIKLEVVGE